MCHIHSKDCCCRCWIPDTGPLARTQHGVRGWRMFVLLLFDAGSEKTVSDPSAWLLWPDLRGISNTINSRSEFFWNGLTFGRCLYHSPFSLCRARFKISVSVIVTVYGDDIAGVKPLSADKNNVFLKPSSSNDNDAVKFPLWRRLFHHKKQTVCWKFCCSRIFVDRGQRQCASW